MSALDECIALHVTHECIALHVMLHHCMHRPASREFEVPVGFKVPVCVLVSQS